MDVQRTPTAVYLTGPLAAPVFEALTTTLRYRPKGYQFDPRFKFHKWDGWQPLYTVTSNGVFAFPSGLFQRVLPLLEPHLTSFTTFPTLTPTHLGLTVLPDGLVLRPEQVEAVRLVVMHHAGLLDMAPNAGKTEVMAGICASFRTARCLVLADSAHIVQQDAERLRGRLQEPVEMLGEGPRTVVSTAPGHQAGAGRARIVVSTIQRLHQRLDRPRLLTWLQDFDVLLIDEVHRVTGPKPGQVGQWFPVIGRIPARVRVGLSGSIGDLAAPIVAEAYTGPVLLTVTDRYLIDAGRSADPLIVMPFVGSWAHDPSYADAYEEGIVRNTRRNRLLVQEWMVWAAAHKLKALTLVYRKVHGRTLAREAETFGLRVQYIDGDSSPAEIEAALAASRSGALDGLVASTIANQGWDMPWFDVLINAAAWKSPVATKQKLGRIIRLNPDHPGQRPIVIDPADLSHDLLKRHAKARLSLYHRKQFEVYQGTAEEIRMRLTAVVS